MSKVDIDKRAKKFAIRIIKMVSELPKNSAGYAIGNQVIRSGTSVGANIIEGQNSGTKKEFIYKLNISLKEAKETLYWLDLVTEARLFPESRMKEIKKENNELISILITIIKNSKLKKQ